MKKAISVLLAVVLFVSQLALCAEAAENPLKASDRITQQLAETTARKQEIEAEKLRRENNRKAAIQYAKNSPTTADFSFILNTKTMTKREYEAFKWSFIFTQFAAPFQDSLLSVFDNSIPFQDMIKDGFNVNTVKNYLTYGGTSAEVNSIEGSMLNSQDFNEIVDTIKSNYSLLYLYDEQDRLLYLSDFLYPSFSLFEKFYIYDTVITDADGNLDLNDTNAFNALYYNQDVLTKNSDAIEGKYSIKSKKIPVAAYDSQTYLFLQLAVGIYCKNTESTLADLYDKYGQCPIVVDSYGNICVYTNKGALIFLPNFGNGLLTATDGSDGSSPFTKALSWQETINLYNKWITMLYSTTTRGATMSTKDNATSEEKPVVNDGSGIYGKGFEPIILDRGTKGDQYSEKLAYNDTTVNGKHDLSNSILLVDSANCYMLGDTPLEGDLNCNTNFLNVRSVVNKNAFKEHMRQLVEYFDACYDKNKNLYKNAQDGMDSRMEGALTSSTVRYNGRSYFAPNLIDPKVLEADFNSGNPKFVNENPLFQSAINMGQIDLGGGIASSRTHFYRYAAVLNYGNWEIQSYSSDGSATTLSLHSSRDGKKNTGDEFMSSINETLQLVTTFTDKQTINDERFVSTRAAALDNGSSRVTIFIPADTVDAGQYCDAYTGAEKGMFLARHYDYFSSDIKRFREMTSNAANLCLSAPFFNVEDTGPLAWIANALGDLGQNINLLDNIQYKINWDGISLSNRQLPLQLFEWRGGSSVSTKVVSYLSWDTPTQEHEIESLLEQIYEDFNGTPPGNTEEKYLQFGIKLLDGGETVNDKGGIVNEYGDIDEWYYSDANLWFNDGANNDTNKHVVRIFANRKHYWAYDEDDNKIIDYEAEGLNDEDKHYFTIYLMSIDSEDNDNVTSSDEPSHSMCVRPKFVKGDTFTPMESLTQLKFNLPSSDTEPSDAKDKFVLSCICTLAFMDMGLHVRDNTLSSMQFQNAETGAEVVSALEKVGKDLGFSGEDIMYFFASFIHYFGVDKETGFMGIGSTNEVYFFDEYEYYLRNASEVSHTVGCEDAYNDFSVITYYWDRYYMPKMLSDRAVLFNMDLSFGITTKGDTTAYHNYQTYREYIAKDFRSSLDYSYKQFLEEGHGKKCDSVFRGSADLDIPACHEMTLQLTSFEEYLLTQAENSKLMTEQSNFYNYLDMDTIILFPAQTASCNRTVRLRHAAAEAILRYNTKAEGYNKITTITYNPLEMIMALQRNTDYEHNYLTVIKSKPELEKHVSKEELMDKANEFFDNPVSSISYILAGFLYKAHTTVATGGLGSVFSATWLVESDIYKWIMDRYIAIVTILVVVLLFIKLTQFAMSKTRNYAEIGRSVVSIIAMCLVPLVVFNGFIWAFDSTSQWALAGPSNKMLLSEVNAAVLERTTNDPGVTAELTPFQEQFLSVKGQYQCLSFEEIEEYSIDGPIYRQVPLTAYENHLKFSDSFKTWYSPDGFVPVMLGYYNQSMYYYFYDYIKSEFLAYCKNVGVSGNDLGDVLTDIRDNRDNLDPNADGNDETKLKTARDVINAAEGTFALTTSTFVNMLEDTDFVYDLSINPQLSDRYGGAYAKDLVGLYNLFDTDVIYGTKSNSLLADMYTTIRNSAWRKAMNDAPIIIAEDSIIPKLWTDNNVISEYIAEEVHKGGKRSIGNGTYPIMTSRLDLFSSGLNPQAKEVDIREGNLVLTPFEEKLCALTTSIYEDTLKALEYHKSEIKNESAIQLMAWIATFKVSEAFGLEPSGPIPQTVTLDTVVRTAFIRDLNKISDNTNTMYSLIAQGESIGKCVLVLLLETAIAVAGILRIFIILYLTVASAVIIALRLLHKAPRTTDMIYGIVGNILALLVLHALTLFLVVVSVEWVAGATSMIPGLVLDIAMIIFAIFMCKCLFHLVKNLFKDAINLGGAKIKAGVHLIASKISSMVMHTAGINSIATQLQGTDVNLNANNVAEQLQNSEQMAAEQATRNRERVERISGTLQKVEDEEEDREKQNQYTTGLNNRIVRNSMADNGIPTEIPGMSGADTVSKVASAAPEIAKAAQTGEVSPELVKTGASLAAQSYGGPAVGAVADAAMNTKLGQKVVDKTTEQVNDHLPKMVTKTTDVIDKTKPKE